ncbi:hypothetical protein PRIPAC_72779 [Pristionchus pacificus]|uniref:Hrg-1 n=1 Tax=Pristionchus pacificus TaxID=54126 RepID=A0A2A6C0H3_PRIPA|nr:hypothetical protein PRIPAC_72779 [Pristionchus pacificus]|eukprot:PDM71628.1 hrg-1 [Pristionchus pacificus]
MACAFCTPKIKMIYMCCGVAFGVCAGAWYGIIFHMISATTVAFFSSIFAGIGVYIHVSSMKKWMITWSEAKFKMMFWINLIPFVLCCAGIIGSCVYAGIDHEGLTIDDLKDQENWWMTACWFFIAAKWSGMSAYYIRGYSAAIKAMLMDQQHNHPEYQSDYQPKYIEKV